VRVHSMSFLSWIEWKRQLRGDVEDEKGEKEACDKECMEKSGAETIHNLPQLNGTEDLNYLTLFK